jgi:hypothetical protein
MAILLFGTLVTVVGLAYGLILRSYSNARGSIGREIAIMGLLDPMTLSKIACGGTSNESLTAITDATTEILCWPNKNIRVTRDKVERHLVLES